MSSMPEATELCSTTGNLVHAEEQVCQSKGAPIISPHLVKIPEDRDEVQADGRVGITKDSATQQIQDKGSSHLIKSPVELWPVGREMSSQCIHIELPIALPPRNYPKHPRNVLILSVAEYRINLTIPENPPAGTRQSGDSRKRSWRHSILPTRQLKGVGSIKPSLHQSLHRAAITARARRLIHILRKSVKQRAKSSLEHQGLYFQR